MPLWSTTNGRRLSAVCACLALVLWAACAAAKSAPGAEGGEAGKSAPELWLQELQERAEAGEDVLDVWLRDLRERAEAFHHYTPAWSHMSDEEQDLWTREALARFEEDRTEAETFLAKVAADYALGLPAGEAKAFLARQSVWRERRTVRAEKYFPLPSPFSPEETDGEGASDESPVHFNVEPVHKAVFLVNTARRRALDIAARLKAPDPQRTGAEAASVAPAPYGTASEPPFTGRHAAIVGIPDCYGEAEISLDAEGVYLYDGWSICNYWSGSPFTCTVMLRGRREGAGLRFVYDTFFDSVREVSVRPGEQEGTLSVEDNTVEADGLGALLGLNKGSDDSMVSCGAHAGFEGLYHSLDIPADAGQ